MNAVSLFAGAGGLDVGFERAGFRTVFANEFDHDAAEAWRRNRPHQAGVIMEGDIHDCLGTLGRFRGADVVFGGPPCQGYSVAGKMDPDDPRSALVWRFLDAVRIVQPKVFVMENVAALGRLRRWQAVRDGIVGKGSTLGYGVSYAVHHASDYGVPENRDRVLFIGVRRDIGTPDAFGPALFAHRRRAPVVREILLSAGRYGTAENPQTCTAGITLAKHPVMRRSPYAGMLVNGAGRPVNLDGIAPTLPASMGGNRTPIVDEAALRDPSRPNWFATYHQRLMDGLASPMTEALPPTLRRLTLREAAAIQTFPEGYRFAGRKSKQYRQIGNAVPCLLAEAAARAVREAFFDV